MKIDDAIKPYQVEMDKYSEVSLERLTGKKIKDIYGYVSYPYGVNVFIASQVIFEDGTYFHFEGEHDVAYLSGYGKNAAKFLIDLDELEQDDD